MQSHSVVKICEMFDVKTPHDFEQTFKNIDLLYIMRFSEPDTLTYILESQNIQSPDDCDNLFKNHIYKSSHFGTFSLQINKNTSNTLTCINNLPNT